MADIIYNYTLYLFIYYKHMLLYIIWVGFRMERAHRKPSSSLTTAASTREACFPPLYVNQRAAGDFPFSFEVLKEQLKLLCHRRELSAVIDGNNGHDSDY